LKYRFSILLSFAVSLTARDSVLTARDSVLTANLFWSVM